MNFTHKCASILTSLGVLVLGCLVGLVFLQDMALRAGTEDIGVTVVKLMYQFETPQELMDNQSKLREYLVPDEFERLFVDNDLRVVNTYYKFRYSASSVAIVEHCEGYVLYRLRNDNISPSQYWVFQYSTAPDGRIENVKEYAVIASKEG